MSQRIPGTPMRASERSRRHRERDEAEAPSDQIWWADIIANVGIYLALAVVALLAGAWDYLDTVQLWWAGGILVFVLLVVWVRSSLR